MRPISSLALFALTLPALAAQDAVVELPLLPRAVASFGAAVDGRWLYVQGGHVGKTHDHSRNNLEASFWRLDLEDPSGWESLPDGAPVQGTALVACEGDLYRIGGSTSDHERPSVDALRSIDSVQRFDAARRTWCDLPSLPEPRSSHDACVLDGRLYVVGGWAMGGESNETWHSTAWVLDLRADELSWTRLPDPPVRRRGLAVSAFGDRVAVLGGMDEDGATCSRVDFFDPRTSTWARGPEAEGAGFGAAAAAIGDTLYASGRDGRLIALDSTASEWRVAGRLLLPRIFHRLLPIGGDRLLALGGASRIGHHRTMEVLGVGAELVVQEWSVCMPGVGRDRQGVIARRGAIHVFGGNRGRGQHAFEPEDFTDAAFRLDLASFVATPTTAFPFRRQSVATADERAFGGFGHDGVTARASADVLEWDADSGAWRSVGEGLPAPRTQVGAVEFGGESWILGGLDYDPGREGNAFRFPLDVLRVDASGSVHDTGSVMRRPRRAFGLAVLGTRAFVFGGMGENFAVVAECEALDLESGEWHDVPSPLRPRVTPQVAVVDGRIWVAGGSSRDDSGELVPNPSVELFDPAAGRWTTVVERLPFATRYARMVAVNDHLVFVSAHDAPPGVVRVRAMPARASSRAASPDEG